MRDFNEWLQEGISNGFCGPSLCYTHDGLPLTAQEEKDFETGDPCVHILRLYEEESVKFEIESIHSPSVWRATNSGFTLEINKE